jgi:hypothetical protein
MLGQTFALALASTNDQCRCTKRVQIAEQLAKGIDELPSL